MSRLILLALLATFVVACTPSTVIEINRVPSTATLPPPSPTQTKPLSPTSTRAPLPATPFLEPASDIESGVSEQESGSYLFIESWRHISGSSECDLYRYIDFLTYFYQCPGTASGDCPWILNSKIPSQTVDSLETTTLAADFNTTKLVGFHGDGTSVSRIGGGAASGLDPIRGLPFITPYGTIQSVGQDGTIAVRIEGDDFYIKPLQSWVHRQYADDDWYIDFYSVLPDDDEAHALKDEAIARGCTVVITDRLTNFGLLRGDQIDVGLDLGAQESPTRAQDTNQE